MKVPLERLLKTKNLQFLKIHAACKRKILPKQKFEEYYTVSNKNLRSLHEKEAIEKTVQACNHVLKQSNILWVLLKHKIRSLLNPKEITYGTICDSDKL